MSKKVIAGVVGGAVLVLVVATSTWLFMSNQVRLVWGSETNNGTAIVCGDDTVTTYNNARMVIFRDGSNTPSIDKDALKQLVSKIKATQGYANDPTCQTMLFWVAFDNKDYEGTKTAYEAIKRLHDARNFADSNTLAIASLTSYEAIVKSLSPSAPITEGAGGL
ncbi:MAG: hypothetical protein ACOH18_03830 [Candidatus Saccharimonadaceae bacterium]